MTTPNSQLNKKNQKWEIENKTCKITDAKSKVNNNK
jgi:hypothetical protein